MQRTYGLFYPQEFLTDPLGSIVININANESPQFIWVREKKYKSYGPPDLFSKVDNENFVYYDIISQKVQFLEHIFSPQGIFQIGSVACISQPDSPSCDGKGPFYILGRRYYIDFRVLYFVNTTKGSSSNPLEESIFNPILSIEKFRCNEDYGFFIAVPKPFLDNDLNQPLLTASLSVQNSQQKSIFSKLPTYINHIGALNRNIKYRLSVLVDGNNENSLWDDVILTPGNVLEAVKKVIANGQTSVFSTMEDNSPVVLYPQPANYPNSNSSSFLLSVFTFSLY